MKINEFSEEIASACGMRAKAITSVQKETFRLLRAALGKGERVQIPEFGTFSIRDVAGKDGEPGKKVVRFKMRDGKAGKDGGPRKDRAAKDPSKKSRKKAAKAGEAAEGSALEDQMTAPVAETADA